MVCRFKVNLSLASCKVEFPFFFDITTGSSLVGRSYRDLSVTYLVCLLTFGFALLCVSCVAGAVMGNIFLFVWHSADLLLLTKSVAPQRTTSVRACIAAQRGGDYINCGEHNLFWYPWLDTWPLHRSSAALRVEASHSHFKLIIKK